jgi:SAM-dependent methyltransferase
MGAEEERFAAERERYHHHYTDGWAERDLVVAADHGLRPSDLRRAGSLARELLGDLEGLDVLELGAGSGVDSVMLARRGARVTATDIADASAELIQRRFVANGVTNGRVMVMPAEVLDLPDESFDRVFSRGVLHHADVARAAPEIARVLRPGGRAVFIEPLSENPLLNFAREHLPYPHKTRPKGHQGIRYAHIRKLAASFSHTTTRPMYFTSMLNRAFGFGVEFDVLERFDDWLLAREPEFGRLCRYVVVACTK